MSGATPSRPAPPAGPLAAPLTAPALLRPAPSPNHDARPAGTPVDTLVLHYTGMQSGAAALARLCDPAAQVSAHYLVEEDGTVFALVPEHRRAWHAGISEWRGQQQLNGRSIGIEIVNPGHEWGYRDFPALQMAAVCDLCLDILSRHPIPPWNVVAHSDVAPDRKQDPGEKFDWEGLAANGVGLWPGPAAAPAPPAEQALALLGAIGYRTDLPLPVLLTAFQRHWRPALVDGKADPGTMARLAALHAALVDAGAPPGA
ncbi:N-acetylmuramoyl-L-alanine amidase [Siccirubricoccus phaeus]|uniref:N-acetylmuramoyl-L-alanine amidase n=1 Tax=Siccirubricoccus phaeus TaxID=2595053 RepID=UPI0011F2B5EB|nr:N-acetylmuramoyl-L-alanine amidase [Siccirubricoccus phaeus]